MAGLCIPSLSLICFCFGCSTPTGHFSSVTRRMNHTRECMPMLFLWEAVKMGYTPAFFSQTGGKRKRVRVGPAASPRTCLKLNNNTLTRSPPPVHAPRSLVLYSRADGAVVNWRGICLRESTTYARECEFLLLTTPKT